MASSGLLKMKGQDGQGLAAMPLGNSNATGGRQRPCPLLTARRRVSAIALACVFVASGAGAQARPSLVARVRVTDSTGTPVVGADLSVVRGLREVVATGTTDDAGQRLLLIDAGATQAYQLVVRKLGYRRADRFFAGAGRDTVYVGILMTRIPQSLAAVRVTAAQDAARKSYYIDSDEIANSDRPLFTGVDIIEKLRPDMIYGRGGPHGGCGPIRNVFINGRRVIDVPAEGLALAEARLPPRPARRTDGSGRPTLSNTQYRVPLWPAAILSSIQPEHIAEMTYNDCFEKSAKVNQGANAVFIVLKPGIGYSLTEGSYVIDADTVRAKPRP
jgi:hypothetical protein